ncbi:hypothetical protein ACFL56_02325 [Candidatus Margulisiibacteriota bacterium]
MKKILLFLIILIFTSPAFSNSFIFGMGYQFTPILLTEKLQGTSFFVPLELELTHGFVLSGGTLVNFEYEAEVAERLTFGFGVSYHFKQDIIKSYTKGEFEDGTEIDGDDSDPDTTIQSFSSFWKGRYYFVQAPDAVSGFIGWLLQYNNAIRMEGDYEELLDIKGGLGYGLLGGMVINGHTMIEVVLKADSGIINDWSSFLPKESAPWMGASVLLNFSHVFEL